MVNVHHKLLTGSASAAARYTHPIEVMGIGIGLEWVVGLVPVSFTLHHHWGISFCSASSVAEK